MAKYKGPSFVIEFLLNPKCYDFVKLENLFTVSRHFYNDMLGEILKRYRLLEQSKKYRKCNRQIKAVLKKNRMLENKLKNDPKNKEWKNQLKAKHQELTYLYGAKKDIETSFGYSEYQLHSYAAERNPYYPKLDSNNVQKLATRAFNSVNKMKMGKAKKVHFKKHGTMESIEGKTNKSGFYFRKENDQYVLKLGKNATIPIVIKESDMYAHESIADLKNISYCRIVKRMVRGNVRFYVQLVIKGIPPAKRRSDGSFKRKLGKGMVGIDPSLQFMAIYSSKRALLMELAPSIQNLEDKIRILKRKLDRSRRETNPNKFNPNGTIKKGDKTLWVRSNNYTKNLFKLKELYRKQAAIRKLYHNRLTNIILALGDVFKVEKNNFKAFQKRKKKTTKKNGRYQSKKRYGKSIANKAPSLFLTILKNKVAFLGGEYHKINPRIAKLSQYDHISDTYKKKELKERFHVFEDGTKVQRDLYSAFLAANTNEKTHVVQRDMCVKNFIRFKKRQNIELERIKGLNKKLAAFGL